MEYITGDLKSAWFNGSDVKTMIRTNRTYQNWDIDIDHVDGDLIFCTSSNQILKINKFLGHDLTVLHNDTENIYGLLFYKPEGKICKLQEMKCVLHYNCTTMSSSRQMKDLN